MGRGGAVLLDLSSLHVGKIPSWLINVAINKIAPSVSLHLPPAGMLTCSYYFFPRQVFKKLYHACLNYEEWKATHSKDVKPWRNPEQNKLRVVGVAWEDERVLGVVVLQLNQITPLVNQGKKTM